MDGAVQRGRREVERAVLEPVRRIRGQARRPQGEGDDWRARGNPWASMPSDHFAAACMTAMIMAELGAKAGTAGWAYVAIVGIAVVYLGEHYVVDLIASLAVAEGVRRAEPAVTPLLRLALWIIRALEPPRRRGGHPRWPPAPSRGDMGRPRWARR